MKYKAGYIALVGATNVGKSTLFNRLVGVELSPVTSKPETTWMPIRGIVTGKNYQMVISDTAGIPSKTNKLSEFLADSIKSEIRRADVILMTASPRIDYSNTDSLISYAKSKHKPIIILVNSSDQNIDDHFEQYGVPIIKMSFLDGNMDHLIESIIDLLPYSEATFDPDQLSLETERELMANIIRAKVMELVSEELHHQIAVIIDEIKIRENGIYYIRATIWVLRESQKPIIIGKGGKLIKKIGINARGAIEPIVGAKVFLELYVKIKKGWIKKVGLIKSALKSS